MLFRAWRRQLSMQVEHVLKRRARLDW